MASKMKKLYSEVCPKEMHFLKLPLEMKYHIFSFLDLDSLLSLRVVCKQLRYELQNFYLKESNLNCCKFDFKSDINSLVEALIKFRRCSGFKKIDVVAETLIINELREQIKNGPSSDKFKFNVPHSFIPSKGGIVLFIGSLILGQYLDLAKSTLLYLRKNKMFVNNSTKKKFKPLLSRIINADGDFFDNLYIAQNHLDFDFDVALEAALYLAQFADITPYLRLCKYNNNFYNNM